MDKRKKGFTLVELIVTIVVMSLLLAVGVPSFINSIRDSQMTATANELVAALNLARSESIKRGARVTVCRSENSTVANPACAGGTGAAQWEAGWLVFTDTGSLGTVDGTDTILRVHPPASDYLTLTSSNFTNLHYVTFLPNAQSNSAGEFELCADRTGETKRIIQIGPGVTGRVSLDATQTCT